MSSHSLLQGIFLKQPLNPSLLHCAGRFFTTWAPREALTLWFSLIVTPWTRGHARPPCPSPTLRAYSNSCPLSRWAIQPSHSLSSSSPPTFNHFQHQGLFQSVICIRWPKFWRFSFSISPSSQYSGPISFRIEWVDLLAVQGSHFVFAYLSL